MINKLGKFGEFVKDYEKARRTYPTEVFSFFKEILSVSNPKILDLGCGTGISTRQLARLGEVTGLDPDPVMLAAAKKHKRVRKEKYVLGTANSIPFSNSSFDVITAFSAFHWFTDKKSFKEIKRALKPGGMFFVVNKSGIKGWGEGYRRTITKAIGKEVANFGTTINYNPRKLLQDNGFKKIKVRVWNESELFTVKNALEYVQSVSIWNSVPKLLRAKAVDHLKEYFQTMKKNKSKIERRLKVRVVVGVK